MTSSIPGYKRAMLDWIVANGAPVGTFGLDEPAESRADLARTGIDYERSALGDLSGESWAEDSMADSQTHPGLWADVVSRQSQVDATTGRVVRVRWFVDGETTGITLDAVIAGVLEAGLAGADYWRRLVTPEQAQAAAERAARLEAYLIAQQPPQPGRYLAAQQAKVAARQRERQCSTE